MNVFYSTSLLYSLVWLGHVIADDCVVPSQLTSDCPTKVSRPKDWYSILEAISLENQLIVKTPDSQHSMQQRFGMERIMCSDGVSSDEATHMRSRIKNAIDSTLRFYVSHLDVFNSTDHTTGLAILMAVDDKYGGEFYSQTPYRLRDWISQICDQSEENGMGYCRAYASRFFPRSLYWDKWLEPELLANDQPIAEIGTEKETIWTAVNHECMDALLSRCEVPHICERVMFDPTPRSQYMLTHQLLYRMFAQVKTSRCWLPRRLVDADINRNICSKSLQEAQLLADYGTPFIFRDLFAEYVAFCGFIGYPNFFRDDWLETILSWQSKSDYGCFVMEEGSNFSNSDQGIVRRLTDKEKEMGLESSNEICKLHFTSLGLSALAVAWDYLGDTCAE